MEHGRAHWALSTLQRRLHYSEESNETGKWFIFSPDYMIVINSPSPSEKMIKLILIKCVKKLLRVN